MRERVSALIMLADCIITELPNSKEGFAFRIDNMYHHPIYQKHGLKGETLKVANMVPGTIILYESLLISIITILL
jgi:hypothetical protein